MPVRPLSSPTPVLAPRPARRPVAARPLATPSAVAPQGLKEAPSAWRSWAWVGRALLTGKEALLPGRMPAYQAPSPAQKQQAIARAAGRTMPQRMNTEDAQGRHNADLVNLVVRGSREDLVRALTSQGWVVAEPRKPLPYIKVGLSVLTRLFNYEPGPVSPVYLDGETEELAFNKNVDYNLARDHFRVYRQGTDPVTGQAIWAIAATRDTALSLTMPRPAFKGPWPWNWEFKAPEFGHAIDQEADGERDLIMHDLLASGLVSDWALVKASHGPEIAVTPRPDGRYQVDRFVTDGRVYDVRL